MINKSTKYIIYAIASNDNNKIYIGHTKAKIKKRISRHKSNCNRYFVGLNPNYCTSYEIIKDNNYYYKKLFTTNTDNKEIIDHYEATFITLLKKLGFNCVNHYLPLMINDKRKKRDRGKTHCCCGSSVDSHNYKRHLKSKKHIKYIENN